MVLEVQTKHPERSNLTQSVSGEDQRQGHKEVNGERETQTEAQPRSKW